MKKVLALALVSALAGCSCGDGDDTGTLSHFYGSNNKEQKTYEYHAPQYQVSKKVDSRYVLVDEVFEEEEPIYYSRGVRHRYRNPEPQSYEYEERFYDRPAPRPKRVCPDEVDIEIDTNISTNDGGCQGKIVEKREPVEVVYKKTITKTVYEPKTTEEVKYEKEPYVQGSLPNVEVINDIKYEPVK